MTEIILCSACLVGSHCRYDGESERNEKVLGLPDAVLIPLCPEQLGGMPTPRLRSEIIGGDGNGVLDGYARVLDLAGNDLTDAFIRGANETLMIAKGNKVRKAILKERSPSCGYSLIYDGTFSGKLKKGMGITAALLEREGIKVLTESSL
jgi:uncharacterized protein YbbK (DUF523 family)